MNILDENPRKTISKYPPPEGPALVRPLRGEVYGAAKPEY